MTLLTLKINGRDVESLVEPRTHLADFLREQRRLTGTHIGCEHGVCGACTVLLDGAPIRSCITFAVACQGREVETIESFEQDSLMRDLRESFSNEHGLQCGFCTSGMLITAHDICKRKPRANEQEIRIELSGNLCRCTGYVGIVNAVKSVIEARASSAAATTAITQILPAARALEPFAPLQAPEDTTAHGTTERLSGITSPEKGMMIAESVVIEALAADVWKALSNIPTAASCLPGAEVKEYTETSAKGRVQTKFGPMRASFDGAASITRNDKEMVGSIRGAGIDNLSKTRARGDLTYRVVPVNEGTATRIEINLTYNLVGPLAQFSRSGLIKDFAHRLMMEFGRNLKDRIAEPDAPLRQAELRASALFFSVLYERIKRLFVR